MSIYEKTTRELLADFAAGNLKPGQVFHRQDAVDWFRRNYPKTKPNTVRLHCDGMSINNPSFRKHHPHIKPGAGWDHFFKLGPDAYRLWDPTNDPQPEYGYDALSNGQRTNPDVANDIDTEPEDDAAVQTAREFAFERDLRNYLARNLHVLEEGLRIYEDEDGEFKGIEYPAGGRFIDILALGRDGGYVVIELKVSRGYDRVVGQLLRYMGWIEKNLANGKSVRGVIVASEITDDLKLACSRVAGVRLWQYELQFQLRPVAP